MKSLLSMIVFCFASASLASQVTCTVEEITGRFGSFNPPRVGDTFSIDTSVTLPNALYFSGNAGTQAYIGIGADVTRYIAPVVNIKVGYSIGVQSVGPFEESIDFRVILDTENTLTINKAMFSNQIKTYIVHYLKANCQ